MGLLSRRDGNRLAERDCGRGDSAARGEQRITLEAVELRFIEPLGRASDRSESRAGGLKRVLWPTGPEKCLSSRRHEVVISSQRETGQ